MYVRANSNTVYIRMYSLCSTPFVSRFLISELTIANGYRQLLSACVVELCILHPVFLAL